MILSSVNHQIGLQGLPFGLGGTQIMHTLKNKKSLEVDFLQKVHLEIRSGDLPSGGKKSKKSVIWNNVRSDSYYYY